MSTAQFDTWKTADGVTEFEGATAHVAFDGSGTPAILGTALNVSSITDNATGDYDVNFTTAYSAADYTVVASCAPTTSGFLSITTVEGQTTALVNIEVFQWSAASAANATAIDSTYISVAFFGGV